MISARPNRRRAWRALAALAAVMGARLCLPLANADADVVVVTTPTFPTQVNVGDTNVPASLLLANTSTAPHGGGPLTVAEVMLVPSCGNRNLNCEGAADPGVFELSSTGQGAAGTSCGGRGFTLVVVDQSSGRVLIRPTDNSSVVIGPPNAAGETDTCRIDFTFSVRRAPTIDSAPQTEGAQTNQVAWVVAVHGDGTTGIDQGDDVTTVGTPSPNLLCVLLALLRLC